MKDQSSDNYLRWATAQSLKGNPLAPGGDEPPDVYSENGPHYIQQMEGWTPRHILEGRGGGRGDIAPFYMEAPSPTSFGFHAASLPYYGQVAPGGDFNYAGADAAAGIAAGGFNEQMQRVAEASGMDRYSKDFKDRTGIKDQNFFTGPIVGFHGINPSALNQAQADAVFGKGKQKAIRDPAGDAAYMAEGFNRLHAIGGR